MIELRSRPVGVPPDSAAADLLATDVPALRARAATATAHDVERALGSKRRTVADFAALLSPAAAGRIEDLARAAHQETVQRFGRTIHLFAPLYLSNECVSTCTYCGFSAGNQIVRRTLSPEQVLAEGLELKRRGFRHLLLVAGEHARVISKEYLEECVRILAPEVPSITAEVQVWDGLAYERLLAAGCDGVVVHQETYDRDTYASCHLKGKKRNFEWRLAALDRAGAAGMRRLGVGALLGLHQDWRSEAIAMAVHARALSRRWWRAEVTVALPRLRPAAGGFEPAVAVTDAELVQLLCALRLALPDTAITLSTREPAELRDALVPLGVTHMSAGSHTEPGGYAAPSDGEPQFEISDDRSPAEVSRALALAGYDSIWKDWQRT